MSDDYKQKIISYKLVFYNDDGEVDVPMPNAVWSEIDQAIYEWELDGGE
jgi:hypothetical protein